MAQVGKIKEQAKINHLPKNGDPDTSGCAPVSSTGVWLMLNK